MMAQGTAVRNDPVVLLLKGLYQPVVDAPNLGQFNGDLCAYHVSGGSFAMRFTGSDVIFVPDGAGGRYLEGPSTQRCWRRPAVEEVGGDRSLFELLNNDSAVQHVHPAVKRDVSRLGWRELNHYGLIQRERSFDIQRRKHDLRAARLVGCTHERDACGYPGA